MRLWTMQPIEFYQQFEQTKIMRADKDKMTWLEEEMFVKAYAWMVRQMIQRIEEPPEGVKYPIWAWHTRERKHKKPDLRCTGYGLRGERTACIEFEVEKENVLLSDHSYWHLVLNESYYGKCTNEEEWEMEEEWFDALPEKEQEKAKVESWHRIFDLDTSNNNDFHSVGDYIQATVWEVRWEQVRRVQFFTAR